MEASQQAMEYINTLINKINALSASSEDDRQSKKQVVNQLINIQSYLSAAVARFNPHGAVSRPFLWILCPIPYSFPQAFNA